jgi:hypothetical protein
VSAKESKRPKGGKAKAGDAGVMGSLPSTRPPRIGGRRDAAPAKKPKPERVAPPPPPPPPRARAHGPRPVRAGAPELDDAAPPSSARPPESPSGIQSGTELVTTVVHAAGELAQIGLTVGGQVLKRAVSRIPRP